jgi:hypothetical protein
MCFPKCFRWMSFVLLYICNLPSPAGTFFILILFLRKQTDLCTRKPNLTNESNLAETYRILNYKLRFLRSLRRVLHDNALSQAASLCSQSSLYEPQNWYTDKYKCSWSQDTTSKSGFTARTNFVVKVKFSRYRPEQDLGDPEVKAPDFLDFRHYEGGKVVTLTNRPSLPPGVSWYSFSEAESTPGHMVPLSVSEKIPSYTTGDRSRDPPTISAVP